MRKSPRWTPYILRRGTTWYFRFRLPNEIQSLVSCQELRFSLRTDQIRQAEARAAELYRYICRLKRVAHRLHMKALTEQDATAVLDELFREMVSELERLKWASYQQDRETVRADWDRDAFGDYDELGLEYDRSVSEREIDQYGAELARSNY